MIRALRRFGHGLLLHFVLWAGACAPAESGADWTNESRVQEDLHKSEFDMDFADVPGRLLSAVVESSYPGSTEGPRRPSDAVPIGAGVAVILENNSGRLFIKEGRRVRELPLNHRLVFPAAVRADDVGFQVSDNEGLASFDYSGERRSLLRPFLSIRDFIFLSSLEVVVNPIIREGDSPIVALINARDGTIQRTWGERRPMLVPGVKPAHLASCGDRIFVGLEQEPVVVVLNRELNVEAEIKLPFPQKTELIELARDERMVNPAPGVVTAPTFVAGVACTDASSFFILLDLPWLAILEYGSDNRLVAVHYADRMRSQRHYRGLNAVRDSDQIRFMTIAEDGPGPRAVVQATVVR